MLRLKLLIIAGPYEADRIRRAAVSAGIEAVAVEPGDSLSGWITATRPDVIVLAPQVVNADPMVALAKVRAVPRGRVPLFLVGDAEERDLLESLAEGFFVRPLAPDELLARAREILGEKGRRAVATDDTPDPTPQAASVRAEAGGAVQPRVSARATPLKPLIAALPEPASPTSARPVPPRPSSPASARPARPGLSREPAKVGVPKPGGLASEVPQARSNTAPPRQPRSLGLTETIEAEFDAEIRDVVRAVRALRRPSPAPHATAWATAAAELRDDSSQKTREVPVEDALAGAEPASRARASGAGARPEGEAREAGAEVELDLPSLLARVYLSRLSGRLTLSRSQGATTERKHIVFEHGHPVLAASSRSEDRMGAMLVRQGRFSAAQIAACGDAGASSGRRMGAVLVERGLVKPGELSLLVRRHYEDIIYSLFSWERALWNLGADHSVSGEKILLSHHPAALILEGIRRKYPAERSLAALGGADRVLRLRLNEGASDLIETMGIDAQERSLVLLFDGVRTLAEIAALTGAPADRLYALAWALVVLERVDIVDVAAIDAAPGRARGDGAAFDGRLGPARDAVIDRALVLGRHALVEEGDYFQVLGVSRDATTQEIRRAHEVLDTELSSGALHPTVATELANELREIREVLAEAARLMGNEALRRRYRAALLGAADAPIAPVSVTAGERIPS